MVIIAEISEDGGHSEANRGLYWTHGTCTGTSFCRPKGPTVPRNVGHVHVCIYIHTYTHAELYIKRGATCDAASGRLSMRAREETEMRRPSMSSMWPMEQAFRCGCPENESPTCLYEIP